MSHLKLHRDPEAASLPGVNRFARWTGAVPGDEPESFKFPTEAAGHLRKGGRTIDPVIAGVESTLDDMGERLKQLRQMFERPEGPRAA